jgi:hypothetical protein
VQAQAIKNLGVGWARVAKLEHLEVLWVQIAMRAKKKGIRGKNPCNLALDLGSIVGPGEDAIFNAASEHAEKIVRFVF